MKNVLFYLLLKIIFSLYRILHKSLIKNPPDIFTNISAGKFINYYDHNIYLYFCKKSSEKKLFTNFD